ncbi:hypothetical protein [Streptomyces endophytica]|uniref:UDP-N-acetylglucosamine 2-epimerase domain-containing protein n=1 Tax=Streptomyces endophytica TaxID=2991496 RepID=A0ABY6P9S2_9ACTN|nr:hypothetical protein [Streptomyces endophytica]UZJ30544.1 hypothetical protein OJ254_09490 [Streptomyces endophytica]
MTALRVFEGRQQQPLREWLTLTGRKRVLVVVHTVPYGKRLQEVFCLLESDLRVQVVFTAPPHPFSDGVARLIERLGGAVLPWEVAVRMEFDLALAAGPRGVEQIRAPLIMLPHGANFLKRVTEGAVTRVAGLGRQDLTPGGRGLPAAVVLPHRDDLAGLAYSCPEALPVATVVGDPVHDRMVASLPRRGAYRRALGLGKGEKLIAVVSTWGSRSSFGAIEALLPRLLELVRRNRKVAVLVHPNVWSGHGAWQVRAWLAQCVRRGIAVVPPEADWRSVLIAADTIIGDHGSVTLYGTLTGVPILLAASPEQEINPASPAAALARTAPALSPAHSLASQLTYVAAEYHRHHREEYGAIAARITSEPGRFSRNMRRLLYGLLGLGQPAHPAPTRPLPLPPPLASWSAASGERYGYGPDTGTGVSA